MSGTTRADRAVRAAGLFAALHVVFTDLHPAGDQIIQTNHQATTKAERSWAGRRACAGHVATYTGTQIGAAWLVCRALGLPVRLRSIAAGHLLITAPTHYALDRRTLLLWLARHVYRADKYLEWGKVVRGWTGPDNGWTLTGRGKVAVIDSGGGPGTAQFELDQATHRALGLVASLVITWLAIRNT